MTTSSICLVKETILQIKGEDRVLIGEDIIAAYASIEDARNKVKEAANRLEKEHYMADFKMDVVSSDFIALSTSKYVFTFAVLMTSLCGK